QAVMSRRWLSAEEASDLGRLDAEAIARVRAEAWPEASNADELHDALVWLGFLTADEVRAAAPWSDWLAEPASDPRVALLEAQGASIWLSAERWPQFRALWPDAKLEPPIVAPGKGASACSREQALVEILRGRLEGVGPITQEALTGPLALTPGEVATT